MVYKSGFSTSDIYSQRNNSWTHSGISHSAIILVIVPNKTFPNKGIKPQHQATQLIYSMAICLIGYSPLAIIHRARTVYVLSILDSMISYLNSRVNYILINRMLALKIPTPYSSFTKHYKYNLSNFCMYIYKCTDIHLHIHLCSITIPVNWS